MISKKMLPEIATYHHGHPIYHTYHDGDYDSRKTYSFTFDFHDLEESFDIRDHGRLNDATGITHQERQKIALDRLKELVAQDIILVPYWLVGV
jgi:hypothetical protein